MKEDIQNGLALLNIHRYMTVESDELSKCKETLQLLQLLHF